MKFRALLCCLFLIQEFFILAQDKINKDDSLSVVVSAGTLLSTNNNVVPFYLLSNQFGEVDPNDNFFLSGQLQYEKSLGKNFKFTSGFGFRNDIFSKY